MQSSVCINHIIGHMLMLGNRSLNFKQSIVITKVVLAKILIHKQTPLRNKGAFIQSTVCIYPTIIYTLITNY